MTVLTDIINIDYLILIVICKDGMQYLVVYQYIYNILKDRHQQLTLAHYEQKRCNTHIGIRRPPFINIGI